MQNTEKRIQIISFRDERELVILLSILPKLEKLFGSPLVVLDQDNLNKLKIPDFMKINAVDSDEILPRSRSIFLKSLEVAKKFWPYSERVVFCVSQNNYELALAAYVSINYRCPLLIIPRSKIRTLGKNAINFAYRVGAKEILLVGNLTSDFLESSHSKIRRVDFDYENLPHYLFEEKMNYLVVAFADNHALPAVMHAYLNHAPIIFVKNISSIADFIKNKDYIKYVCLFLPADKLNSRRVIKLYKIFSYRNNTKLQRISFGVMSNADPKITRLQVVGCFLFTTFIEDGPEEFMVDVFISPLEGKAPKNFAKNLIYLSGESCKCENLLKRLQTIEENIRSILFYGHAVECSLAVTQGNICAINYRDGKQVCPWGHPPCNYIKKFVDVPDLPPVVAFFNTCRMVTFGFGWHEPCFNIALHFVEKGAITVATSFKIKQGYKFEHILVYNLLSQGYSIGEVVRLLNNWLVSYHIDIPCYIVIGDPQVSFKSSVKAHVKKCNPIPNGEEYHITVNDVNVPTLLLEVKNRRLYDATSEGRLYLKCLNTSVENTHYLLIPNPSEEAVLIIIFSEVAMNFKKLELILTESPPISLEEETRYKKMMDSIRDIFYLSIKTRKFQEKLDYSYSLFNSLRKFKTDIFDLGSYNRILERKELINLNLSQIGSDIVKYLYDLFAGRRIKWWFAEQYLEDFIPIISKVIKEPCQYCGHKMVLKICQHAVHTRIKRAQIECLKCGGILDIPVLGKTVKINKILKSFAIFGKRCVRLGSPFEQFVIFKNNSQDVVEGLIGLRVAFPEASKYFSVEPYTHPIRLKPGEKYQAHFLIDAKDSILPNYYVLVALGLINFQIYFSSKIIIYQ